MKNLKIIAMLGLMLTFTLGVMAKEADSGKPVVKIQTNAQCSDCKARLEGELNFVKGIIYAELDIDTKVIEIKYNAKRINIDEIRKQIAELGYDADDVQAVKEKQEALPSCCQPGGH